MSTKPKVLRVKGVGIWGTYGGIEYLRRPVTYGMFGSATNRKIAMTMARASMRGDDVLVDCTITIHPGKRGKR